MSCQICPHHCSLDVGEVGKCQARTNDGTKIIDLNYGRLTSVAIDPIEKKPLYKFYPGSKILSVGSFGCNLKCKFCQNYEISMSDVSSMTQDVTPDYLAQMAFEFSRKQRNIGVAFTYNEPMISYEFVRDTSIILHKIGLKSVLVTNGMICEQPLRELLPLIDAMNIDLKAFNKEFYEWIDGDFETVKRTIEISAKSCHVELTTLIIPNKNDSESEMEEEAKWIASISPDIPLHISRYFPRYKYKEESTSVEKIYQLVNLAQKYLKYVYPGNC